MAHRTLPTLVTTLKTRYQALVSDGHLDRDPAQAAVVNSLDRLAEDLAHHRLARKSSALGWLFGQKPRPPLKGLYIWGSVGRGKTMLMDMFFEQIPVTRKRRAHFHSFMADVHERIHQWRQADHGTKAPDPIEPVAEALAGEAWVLCFDEFTVTDITDAMILGRLFKALWAKGVVIVATSNVEPSQLYKNGLNRALFTPFIDLLLANVAVVELDARTDYRLEKLGGGTLFYAPNDERARLEMDAWWKKLTGSDRRKPTRIVVKSREVEIPAAASGVARFGFEDLCAKPLGASDYLAIARAYHTILIEDVPRMDLARRNEAKRFITLIDVLYENHVKLIMSAEAEVDALYGADSGFEAFEFDRTVSRLIEMRSDEYLGHPHGSRDSLASGHTTGLVET
ncbi:MAG: AFG1 family ATPase [Beijerinckiaceae bacterium]|nr:AFG1 family ATPase [Beijerinckiaceae bacterium]